jgi:hypothetical protein
MSRTLSDSLLQSREENWYEAGRSSRKGRRVSKDKKSKKSGKKAKKREEATGSLGGVAKGLKTIADNPLVAEVVVAALLAAAAALKDSKKVRKLADVAGEKLDATAKEGADRSGPMWQMALEVGRRTLDAMANETSNKPRKSK